MANRAFPPQPLNFEDEAGILRDLPSSPPSRIHKLIIDVDDLGQKDFVRLNELYCHRVPISEWILGVSDTGVTLGFTLTRLFSLMKLFRPKSLMVQQSTQILTSPAFREFLQSSRQLWLLVIDCSQDYELSNLDLSHIKELRVNVLQDQHVETISNLVKKGISKLHLWVSHGITTEALQGLVLPPTVTTLSLSSLQVSFQQFRALSQTIRRHETIQRLEIRWKGSSPLHLLGLEPCRGIRCLEIHMSKFSTLGGSDKFVKMLPKFLSSWNHVIELRLCPNPVSSSVSRLEREHYISLFHTLRNTSFTALSILGLRVGTVLDEDLCKSLVQVVKNIPTLKGFQLAAQFAKDGTTMLEKVYTAKFNFYCDLHAFPNDVLSMDIPLKLWPQVLHRGKDMPSILFHFLQSKNDLLMPARSNVGGDSHCGKRKRVDDDDMEGYESEEMAKNLYSTLLSVAPLSQDHGGGKASPRSPYKYHRPLSP